MHVKSLKIFCDIVARRSFSRAADDNGMSQSSASQIVQQLEDELNVQLLDRSKRPFVLTPEGAIYYNGCKKIVERLDALEEEVRTLHQEVAGRVSVASIYSIGLSHLSHCVKNFLSQNPKANVRIEYQHPNRVIELVEEDQVDIGLVSYPKPTRSLNATVWREEPMVVVCAPTHSFADQSSVKIQDLHQCDLIGFDEDLKIRREIDRVLSMHHVEPRIAMEFDNIETIKRAIEIDAGISLLPAPSVDRELTLGTLVARPLADAEMSRPIGLIHRRGKVLGNTAKRFIHLLLHQRLDTPLDSIEGLETLHENAPAGGDLHSSSATSELMGSDRMDSESHASRSLPSEPIGMAPLGFGENGEL
jgi:DNA-binding transcriptional LysR family regulator